MANALSHTVPRPAPRLEPLHLLVACLVLAISVSFIACSDDEEAADTTADTTDATPDTTTMDDTTMDMAQGGLVETGLDVEQTIQGNPNFRLIDVQLFPLNFSAENDAPGMFTNFNAFVACLVAQEGLTIAGSNILVPVTPTETPGQTLLDQSLATCEQSGTSTQTYMASQVDERNGIWLSLTVVPDSTTGSQGTTSIGTEGRILPDALFPLTLRITLREVGVEGNEVDLYPDGLPVQGLGSLEDTMTMMSFAGEGYSHLPFVSPAFLQPDLLAGVLGVSAPWLSDKQMTNMSLAGSYEIVVSVTDPSQNGWTFTLPFEVQ